MSYSFRPLTGNYISQLNPGIVDGLLVAVSVPLRGTTFLNMSVYATRDTKIVSVPLRGTTFLNAKRKKVDTMKVMFPSPYGELHFSIIFAMGKGYMRQVSVPLRGTTFLNQQRPGRRAGSRGFRPLTGNYISQFSRSWSAASSAYSFRPLTGNYISQ